jgi:hypothetical protein
LAQKPLAKKLGIKQGLRICILNQPEGYLNAVGNLPPHVTAVKELEARLDFIHFFVYSRKELETTFPLLKKKLSLNGMLWVSWPKSSARFPTDLNENVVREIGLRNGLVDVKVVAIDKTWSGLKFVRRIQDR